MLRLLPVLHHDNGRLPPRLGGLEHALGRGQHAVGVDGAGPRAVRLCARRGVVGRHSGGLAEDLLRLWLFFVGMQWEGVSAVGMG